MSQRRESGGGRETVSTSYTFALKGTKDANFSLLKKAVEMCINHIYAVPPQDADQGCTAFTYHLVLLVHWMAELLHGKRKSSKKKQSSKKNIDYTNHAIVPWQHQQQQQQRQQQGGGGYGGYGADAASIALPAGRRTETSPAASGVTVNV